MPTYIVEFERVGRNHEVPPLTVAVDGEADLARHIRSYIRPHLRSRDFDVMLDMDAGAGWLACGMHSGGTFSVTDTTTSSPKRAQERQDRGAAALKESQQ